MAVAVPAPVAIVAFVGEDRVRVKVSGPSTSESARTATSIVCVRSPGSNESVPEVAV